MKWSLLAASLLYAELSFLTFLLTQGNLATRLPLVGITILSLCAVLFKPRLTFVVVYSVVYSALAFDSLLGFYWRVHFNQVTVTGATLLFYLALPSWWFLNVVTGILIQLRNRLDRKDVSSTLRVVLGLSILLVVFIFADLYYTIALITSGEAFEYTPKAITSQQKRKLAHAFPGLPDALFAALVEEYDSGRRDPMIVKDDDRVSGTTYRTENTDGIGENWAGFYKLRLKLQGITQYRIVKSDAAANNRGHRLYRLMLYQGGLKDSFRRDEDSHWYPGIELWSDRRPSPTTEYWLYLPETMKYNESLDDAGPPPPGGFLLVQPPNTHQGLNVSRTGACGVFPEIYQDYLLDIDSLGLYLCYSDNYLDDSIVEVRDAFADHFLDSYWDYIYFSVVTISTTGYGDIAAADTDVRLLNAAEIGLGWLLLTAFASMMVAAISLRLRKGLPGPAGSRRYRGRAAR